MTRLTGDCSAKSGCSLSLPCSLSLSLALSPFFVSLEKRYVLCRCFAARSTVRISCTVVVREKRPLAPSVSLPFSSLSLSFLLLFLFLALLLLSRVSLRALPPFLVRPWLICFSLSLSLPFSFLSRSETCLARVSRREAPFALVVLPY